MDSLVVIAGPWPCHGEVESVLECDQVAVACTGRLGLTHAYTRPRFEELTGLNVEGVDLEARRIRVRRSITQLSGRLIEGPTMRGHDLRHNYASLARSVDADMKLLQVTMGYVSIMVSAPTYSDLYDSDLDRVSAHLTGSAADPDCGLLADNPGGCAGLDRACHKAKVPVNW